MVTRQAAAQRILFKSLCRSLSLARCVFFRVVCARSIMAGLTQHLPAAAGLHPFRVAPGHGQLGPLGELRRPRHHARAHRDRREVHGTAGLVPQRNQGAPSVHRSTVACEGAGTAFHSSDGASDGGFGWYPAIRSEMGAFFAPRTGNVNTKTTAKNTGRGQRIKCTAGFGGGVVCLLPPWCLACWWSCDT